MQTKVVKSAGFQNAPWNIKCLLQPGPVQYGIVGLRDGRVGSPRALVGLLQADILIINHPMRENCNPCIELCIYEGEQLLVFNN